MIIMTVMTTESRSSLLLASWFPSEPSGPCEIRLPVLKPILTDEQLTRQSSDNDHASVHDRSTFNHRHQERDDNEPTTVEAWLQRLGSILIETRGNLDLILSAGNVLQVENQIGRPLEMNRNEPSTELTGTLAGTQTSTVTMKTSSVQTDMMAVTKEEETKSNHRSLPHSQLQKKEPFVSSNASGLPFQQYQIEHGCHNCSSVKTRRRRRRHPPTRNRPVTIGRVTVVQQEAATRPTPVIPLHSPCSSVVHLNDAWQFAGQHTRQRMALLRRHYRRLYHQHKRLRRRCRRLSRIINRARRRANYLQYQHRVLLESIGHQVDNVTSNWADFLKGFLKVAENSNAGTSQSGSNPLSSRSLLVDTEASSASLPRASGQGPSTTTTPSSSTCRSRPSSLYHWYSSLSLKLSWLQSSHTTVFDNILSAWTL